MILVSCLLILVLDYFDFSNALLGCLILLLGIWLHIFYVFVLQLSLPVILGAYMNTLSTVVFGWGEDCIRQFKGSRYMLS